MRLPSSIATGCDLGATDVHPDGQPHDCLLLGLFGPRAIPREPCSSTAHDRPVSGRWEWADAAPGRQSVLSRSAQPRWSSASTRRFSSFSAVSMITFSAFRLNMPSNGTFTSAARR